MADAPSPITSPPAQDFQPYDASESASPALTAPWMPCEPAGPCDMDGRVTGDGFGNGPGPWKQT